MSASAHLTRSLDPESLLKGLDPEKRLSRYFELLVAENKRVNLVSRETIQSGLPKLAAESLLPFESVHPTKVANHLDIGSGGGFPAFPILLTQEIQNATLVERTQKKAAALRRMLRGLSVDANIIERSFEELSLAANFDLITIRLVKLTPKIYTKVLAALKPGGTLVYYAEWDKSLSTEGLRRSSISYQIPPSDIIKHISILNK
jgi:16S rRNA (guanine527-N7)-methyltransferase